MARIEQGMQAGDAKERKSTGSDLTTYLSIWQISIEFDAALKINPIHSEARINKGTTLKLQRKPQEALIEFDTVLQIDPNNAKARDSVAKLQQFELQQSVPGGH